MSAANWITIGLFLGGLSAQLGGIKSWDEALTPLFISGLLLTISSNLVAFFSHKPGVEDDKTIARKD